MASFFSFTRRRTVPSEELELGSSDSGAPTAAGIIALAPDTPPSASESRLLAETSPTTTKSAQQRKKLSNEATAAFISTDNPTGHHLQDSSFTRPSTSSSHASASPHALQSEEFATKVRARAAYFEALICCRAGRGSDEAALLPASLPVGSDDAEDPTAFVGSSPLPPCSRIKNAAVAGSPKPLTQLLPLGGITAAAAADALESLRLELERIEEERARAVTALRRKAEEVDNLQSIVKQLGESRALAMQARAQLAEQCVDLKRSHDRVTRVADLSRAVSRENMEMTKAARDAAAVAEREAGAARREAAAAARAELKAAEDNERLRRRVAYLERCPVAQGESVVKREMTSTRVVETY